jgi:hypothetical protein
MDAPTERRFGPLAYEITLSRMGPAASFERRYAPSMAWDR